MHFLLKGILPCLISSMVWAQNNRHEISLNAYYDRVNHGYIKFQGLQKQNLLYKGAPSFQINYNYNINQIISVGSGIGYSRRGFVTENTDYASIYIQVPLRIGVELYQNRYMQIISYGGGYIGIPLSDSKTIKDNYFSTSGEDKKTDVGLESGVNVVFKLSDNYHISFIPRFQFGLSNIYQEYYYEKRRNIAFSVGIGVIRKI
ncbi:outer membrane beta-barrel protein [Chryseobacterium sp. MYb264]|uniref:outer membrane beta-barrel protein n=1 Tax=Chryseobacterium sp. MYb264 TaxID=2745153 RepID=UPI002E0F3A25|nr:outer membrane beta-barrel protein [Chryseobacterium sp. MYb264]